MGDYNPSAALVTNDIALIRLDEPVPLYDEADEAGTRRDPKPGANPVCLPWPSTIEETKETNEQIASLNNGDKVTVTGWGRTSNRNRDEVRKLVRNKVAKTRLQYLKTKTANELCKEKISQDIDTEKVLCAGGQKGEDSCNGDSGGPLMSLDGAITDFKNPKFLRGIVSFGSQNCGSVRPFTIHILY